MLMLDSGSIGRAGANFAKQVVCLNMFVGYDKFHRMVRDIKLAADHACNSDLYRALLHLTFVWSLNQRPFGSGAWFEAKKDPNDHMCTLWLMPLANVQIRWPHYEHTVFMSRLPTRVPLPTQRKYEWANACRRTRSLYSVCSQGRLQAQQIVFEIALWAKSRSTLGFSTRTY